MRALSLGQRLVIFCIFAGCIALAGLGLNGLVQQSYASLVAQSEILAKAGRNHALADMHHDGAKGAIYRMLHAAAFAKDTIDDAHQDFRKQSEQLALRMADVRGLPLSEAARSAIAQSDAPTAAYKAAATRIAEQALAGDMASANRDLPRFEEIFDELAKVNDAVGDAIEKQTEQLASQSLVLNRISLVASIGAGVSLMLLFASSLVLLRRQVVAPLAAIAVAVERISTGESVPDLASSARRDEIGRVARAVDAFKESRMRAAKLESDAASSRVSGEARQARIEAALSSFDRSVGAARHTLVDAVGQLGAASADLSAIAEEASANMRATSQSAAGSAEMSRRVAAATGALTASVQEVGAQIRHAASAVDEAAHLAVASSAGMTQLADNADKIGSIVVLIRSIAEQTNLLALNATIEAARAGEAGRGFAVVASEVKALASQTAAATQDIAAQVDALQAGMTASVGTIAGMVVQVKDANGAIQTVVDAIGEQGAAIADIASSSERSARELAALNGMIDLTTEIAARATASAELIGQVSQTVSGETTRIDETVAVLLREVNAA